MDFIVSSIIGGIVYDLVKEGYKLTLQNVFGNFYGIRKEQNIDIYNEFLRKINREEDALKKKEVIKEALTEKNQYAYIFERNLYNTNFAKRLDYIMYIINYTKKYEKSIDLEYLGEFLGYDSVNELMKYYKYEEEPTYQFCEEVANKLGVNVEWLKNGKIDEKIFKTGLPIIYEADELLEHRKSGEFTFHFVINDDVDKREIIVIRKYNELKFEYYPCSFIFNSHVGAGGIRCLLSLYSFLCEIRKKGNEITNVHIVSKELFDNILGGKEYCGVIERYGATSLINILDDFLDICHEYPISENYGMWYGEDFLKTQEVILNKLSKI